MKNRITQGAWVVRGVDLVDDEARQVWFRAGGIRQGQDPYYVHYCRVDFDGTNLVVLTEGDGTHSVEFSPDRRFFAVRWSRVALPPLTELRSSDDGRLVCELERAARCKGKKGTSLILTPGDDRDRLRPCHEPPDRSKPARSIMC